MTSPSSVPVPRPSEPLPCPWCEKAPNVDTDSGGDGGIVACSNPDCPVAPSVYASTEVRAITLWNRRSPSVPTATQEQREAGVADATYWRERAALQSQLAGSISERERLTAQNEATQKRCDEIKAALEAARHALTVSHGLTATDKPQAYEDSILHDGCDALQARDVQREVSWEIDNSKEIAMIDAVLPFTPQCPDCKSVLSRIVRPEGNTLSDEAFSREYGDWRCDTCPPNNATWHPYRVFWNARTEPHD